MVFTAVDKTTYIRLFEKGQDFELCLEEDNIFTGTYALSKDTVFLMYRENLEQVSQQWNAREPELTMPLPKKLHINMDASRIKSTDDLSFSAAIHMDMREKLLKSQDVNILASIQGK